MSLLNKFLLAAGCVYLALSVVLAFCYLEEWLREMESAQEAAEFYEFYN